MLSVSYALGFTVALSPIALADLPLDVIELTRTEVLLEVQGAANVVMPEEEHRIGFAESRWSGGAGGPGVLSFNRTDSVGFAEGFLMVDDHAIDADGVRTTTRSSMRFGHSGCDLDTSGHALYSMSEWYRLRTSAAQRITLTIEITGSAWPGYSLGHWELDGLRPNPDRTVIDDVGLLFRPLDGSAPWYRVPQEVLLPSDHMSGDTLYKLQCRVGLPAGEYELLVTSKSARFSTDQCESLGHLSEAMNVSLTFESALPIPAGLSMFAEGPARVRSEIRDDEALTLIDWKSSGTRGVPATAEEGATLSYAMGLFGSARRSRESYGYTFWSEGGVGSLFDGPSGDGAERTLEVNADTSFRFVADESMRLHITFPSWLDSDWDERAFAAEIFDLETGDIIAPIVVRDHGRQYIYQLAPGSYEFIHVLSMHRRVVSSGQSVSLEWKDDIDAHVLFRILGDTNGDGRVDGQDLSLLLGSWGQEDPTVNLDAHDVIDGRDLSVLLGNWDR